MQPPVMPYTRPMVSVVIAAFNCAQTIERAVCSAMEQSVTVEIIIVDDASTDRTWDIINELAAADSRVRIDRCPENSGPSVARNRGIAAATGTWIAILDADDAFLPGRLQRMTMVGERRDADLLCDNLACYDWAAQQIVGSALPLGVDTVTQVGIEQFICNAMTGRSRFDYGQLKPVVRRDFLLAHCLRYPPDLRHGEDFAFIMDCLLADARFTLIGDALYLFTQRIGSISSDLSGQSRTVVNLRAMRDHTLSLFKRPRVRESRILLSLLQKRADAIDHQLSWSRAYPYLRARQPLALMREMMRDWRNWPMLVRHLIRRHQNNYLSS